jgi:hypothetical protein
MAHMGQCRLPKVIMMAGRRPPRRRVSPGRLLAAMIAKTFFLT